MTCIEFELQAPSARGLSFFFTLPSIYLGFRVQGLVLPLIITNSPNPSIAFVIYWSSSGQLLSQGIPEGCNVQGGNLVALEIPIVPLK